MSATKRVSGNYTIKTVGSGSEIKLVSESVVSEAPLSLRHQLSAPSGNSDYLVLYTAPASNAGSGVFFVNDTESDELVSKKRAILFSLLF